MKTCFARTPSLPLLTSVILLFFAQLSMAQRAEPVITNITHGGRALAIATRHDNPDHLIVASETGGLFRSADGGSNWRQVSGNFTYEFSHVAFAPFNNQLVIATAYKDFRKVSGGGIWRSTNSGGSFTKVSTPLEGCSKREEAFAVAFEPNSTRIWTGTACGLFYSDDEGSTWTALPASGSYTRQPIYAVKVPAPGKLRIMTANSVLISEDRGITWFTSSVGVPTTIVDYNQSKSFNQLAVSPLDPNHIFWAVAFNEERYFNDQNGVRQRILAAITAIFLSTDNGVSWRELHREELPRHNRPVSVILTSGNGTLYELYFNNGVGSSKALIGTINNQLQAGAWLPLASIPHLDNIDVSFLADGRTLNMLAGDGGIYKTTNNGRTFTPAGFHRNGYNALQLYQVAGQLKNGTNTSTLYLGTQDNGFWSSTIANGVSSTWPESQSLSGEGRFIELLRRHTGGLNAVTGTYCCSRFIADPLFQNSRTFPGCPGEAEAPKLLGVPAHYLQQSTWSMDYGTPYFFSFGLGSWQSRFNISRGELPSSFPQISGRNSADPVVFITTRSNNSNMPHEELQRITGVMNLSSGTPIKSTIEGYGKMGASNIGFAFERLFAVNPKDPYHIIVPDLDSGRVRVTYTGGRTWEYDDVLTNLVTDNGTFMFNQSDTLFISAINFHPDNTNTILVGTRQNGAFLTNDRGTTWKKIENSENIPLITSFYFESEGAEISSYGRGLWHIPSIAKELPKVHYEKYLQWLPYFYRGCFFPLNSIIHPEELNAVRLMSVNKGCITGYETDEEGNLTSIYIDKGEVTVMDLAGMPDKKFDIPVKIGKGKVTGIDEEAQLTARKNKWNIKGLLIEGKKLKGPVYFGKDLNAEHLPKPRKEGHFFALNLPPTADGYRISSFTDDVQLQGSGWDPSTPIQILMDGQTWQDKVEPKFDSNGNLQMSLYLSPSLGKHTLTLSQKTTTGFLSASTVINYNFDEEYEEK